MQIRLLTARELERILRYSPGHATRLAKAGKLPYLILPDGEVRFDETEIERLLYSSDCAGQGKQEGRS